MRPVPETEQSLERGHGLPAPIVAKDGFIKINLKLIAAHAVIAAAKIIRTTERHDIAFRIGPSTINHAAKCWCCLYPQLGEHKPTGHGTEKAKTALRDSGAPPTDRTTFAISILMSYGIPTSPSSSVSVGPLIRRFSLPFSLGALSLARHYKRGRR